MPTLSYDLHLHPGPSPEPRWGDGEQVWRAARDAGVKGFVWKDHHRHTADLCARLPATPVEAIGSASLNAWASLPDIVEAIERGASWLWGPTQTNGQTAWDLPLPSYWNELAAWLAERRAPVVLATGHTDAIGRRALAELAAAHGHLLCSVTHSLLVPVHELLALAEHGCVFEIDAYTLSHDVGRHRGDLNPTLQALGEHGALVYFTSDGGQASTGNPFEFGARTLDEIATRLGMQTAVALGVENPARVVAFAREPGAA